MKLNFLKSRKFKHGSMAVIVTIGFVISVVLVNVVAGLVLDRFPVTINLTGDSRNDMSEETVEFLGNLQEEINIYLCVDETRLSNLPEQYKQAHEMIKNYERRSDKIKLSYVNLERDPNFDKKYPDLTISDMDIIIESSMRHRQLSFYDMIEQRQNNQTQETIVVSVAEQKMTGAIEYVADVAPVSVSLLTGLDSAADVSAYRTLLESNNYAVVEQNIMNEEIDPNTSFVILPQPAQDLGTDQVKKLEAYLDNNSRFGKSLVFVASPIHSVGPVLKAFLADWGMEIGDALVCESDDKNVYTSRAQIFGLVADEKLKENLTTVQDILTPNSRPVNTLFETSGNRTTTIMTNTAETAFLLPFDVDDTFDMNAAEKNSYNTIVMGSRLKYDGTTPLTSKVVCVGSSDMLATQWMGHPQLGNSTVMLTLTGMLAEKKNTISVLPFTFEVNQIMITEGIYKTYFTIFVFVLPVIVVIVGLVIWLRRRHL